MSLGIKRVDGTPSIPVFQKVLETSRGGYKLDTTGLTAGEVLKAGTAISFDETTRIAKQATVNVGDETTPASTDANGLLYNDTLIEDNAFVTVVTRGTVYENRIPETEQTVKDALPLIIFSKSF